MGPPPEILGFEVLATLGHGAKSTIYAVKDKEGNLFALKHVIRGKPTDQRYLDQAILEHDVASRFDHPALRKSYRILRQRSLLRTSEICVLMELVDGVTMEEYEFPGVLELCRMMQRVAEGLGRMHEGGYVHADIKPTNILVTDEQAVKIIDFGQSCPIGTVKERIQGTPNYIAPEQVYRKQITPRTDVFNLGASLYWLLTRQHIPTALPRGEVGALKPSDKIATPRDINPQTPPALSTLIMDCVDPSPRHRPTSMCEVQQRLDMAMNQIRRESGT